MLRLTELKLPLDHAEGAVAAASLQRLGIARRRTCSASRSSGAARRAQEVRDRADLHARRRGAERSRRCSQRFEGRPHVSLAPDTAYRFVAQAPAAMPHAPGRDRLRPVRLLRRAGARADGLSARSCSSAARRCASAPRTPGACGASACSTRNRTCSSARAAPAPSPTASSTARSRTRATYGRKVLTEFVKAGAPEEILYVGKPHIGTFRLVTMVEKMRAEIEALGGEIRFEQRVDRPADRGRRDGGAACAAWRSQTARRSARRPRRARARPQRARHLRRCCTSAACSSRPSRSRSAFASSIRSR